MDLSIRDWMLVIGVLLILAVLLDGYRRVRKAHAAKIRMSLKPVPQGSEEELTRGELPNGGARVAPRVAGGRSSVHREPTFGDEMAAASAVYAADRFDDATAAGAFDEVATREPASHASPVSAALDDAGTRPEPVAQQEAPPRRTSADVAPAFTATHAPAREPIREPIREPEPVEQREEVVSSKPAADGIREIIIVNAISKDPQGFNGEELLHILLTCDLRFGKMNIFHRYEKSNAKGAVQFSVANAVEPGTFDLNNMRSFRTPGICLFLQLPGPQDAQKALEYMVETAQCIARNLNGELRDENRSALTAQTVEHYRSRIREFDRKRMAKHA